MLCKMFVLKMCALLCSVSYVQSHGRLILPPQRSSLWRFGFNSPVNVNDNELNCGGLSNQWNNNGGKCGLCGDPWEAAVRENEAGGTYANGIIAATYFPGESIDVQVDITANHLGFFEFRLCPQNDPTTPITQECLDQHLLQVHVGHELVTQYFFGSESRVYDFKVKLPDGLTCSQCVLQWFYRGGNNWGCDSPGDCGTGKGPQETFVNCADIAISTEGPTPAPSTPQPTAETSTPKPPTTVATQAPTTPHSGELVCEGIGTASDEWCNNNCNAVPKFCPESECDCY